MLKMGQILFLRNSAAVILKLRLFYYPKYKAVQANRLKLTNVGLPLDDLEEASGSSRESYLHGGEGHHHVQYNYIIFYL
jgi:hypothetical protein